MLFDNDLEYIIRSLLCEEFGSTVGEQLFYSKNVKIMYEILKVISRKKTEKSFSERLHIREEIKSLLKDLLEDEKILGVSTYEWVVSKLVEVEAVGIDPTK